MKKPLCVVFGLIQFVSQGVGSVPSDRPTYDSLQCFPLEFSLEIFSTDPFSLLGTFVTLDTFAVASLSTLSKKLTQAVVCDNRFCCCVVHLKNPVPIVKCLLKGHPLSSRKGVGLLFFQGSMTVYSVESSSSAQLWPNICTGE